MKVNRILNKATGMEKTKLRKNFPLKLRALIIAASFNLELLIKQLVNREIMQIQLLI
jgi:hypothetical protein